jgi:PAS domain S-box-containing protein
MKAGAIGRSLQRRVTIGLAAGGLLALVATAGGLAAFEYGAARQRARIVMETMAEMIAVSMGSAVDFNDRSTAQETLAVLRFNPAFRSARVVLPDGQAFASWARTAADGVVADQALEAGITFARGRARLVYPLTGDGRTFALVELVTDQAAFARGFGPLLRLSLGVLLLMAVVGLLVGRGLRQKLIGPLLALARTAERVRQEGDYSVRAPVTTSDEVGRLAEAFNEMLAAIELRDRELNAAVAFRATLLDSAGLAIISTDPEGTVVVYNPAAERLLGWPAAEIVGRRTPEVWHDPAEVAQRAAELTAELGEPVAAGFAVFSTLPRRGRGEAREWTFVRRDGERRSVLLVTSALRTPDGAFLGFLGLATDLSEIRRTEAALRASEERYRVITEGSPLGIVVHQDGLIRYVNPAMVRMAGYASQSEVVGCSLAEFIAPEFGAEFAARTRAVLAGAAPDPHPGAQLLDRQGNRFWVQTVPKLIQWEGQPAVMAFVQDISRQRTAEAAWRASEERLRYVVTETGQLIYDWDPASGHTLWEGAIERVTGFTPAEFAAMHYGRWAEHLHPEDRAATEAAIAEGLRRAGRFTAVYRFRRKDGRYIVLEDRGIALSATALGEGRVLGVAVDITARRATEEEIRRLNAELEARVAARTAELHERVQEVELLNRGMVNLLDDLQASQRATAAAAAQLEQANAGLQAANAELEAFSYSVSHDLRAPLRNIAGFVELLRRRAGPALDAESVRYFSIVANEAVRMGTLIDDLLAFSRIGRAELRRTEVRLEELVAEVRDELRPELENRAVEWRVGRLPRVHGDRTLLRQALANLLGNAVKFTRGRNPALIELFAEPAAEPGFATFVVRDNGAGFDPRYTEKLFRVFQRLHHPKQFEGTGVGLATVHRVVARHGGRIRAEGVVDKGAVFRFTLPVADSGDPTSPPS